MLAWTRSGEKFRPNETRESCLIAEPKGSPGPKGHTLAPMSLSSLHYKSVGKTRVGDL